MELFIEKAKILWKTFVIENITMQSEYVQEAMNYHHFNKLPLSMQWGVIEDFAESEGYVINLYEDDGGGKWGIYISFLELSMSKSYGYKHNTRNEARLECIKELNRLINERD